MTIDQLIGHKPPSVLLAIDPGETTGYALFHRTSLKVAGSFPGQHANFVRLLDTYKPTLVVAEDYFIYAWRTAQHSWSRVPTLRLLGGLEMLCYQRSIPLVYQTAAQVKSFCNDAKLRDWNVWHQNKHCRDAIRHGYYYLLFHKERS